MTSIVVSIIAGLVLVTLVILGFVGIRNTHAVQSIASHITYIRNGNPSHIRSRKNNTRSSTSNICDANAIVSDIPFNKILEISQKLTHKKAPKYKPYLYNQGLASILYHLGFTLRNMKKYKKALQFYMASLKIRQRLARNVSPRYKKYVATTLNNIGITLYYMNRYEDTLRYYRAAYQTYCKLSQKAPHIYEKYAAMTLMNIGILYFQDMHDKEKSTVYVNKAMNIMKKYRNSPAYKKFINTAEQILKPKRKEVY